MGNAQSEYMYMFERMNEPLYFGPRGNKNAYYNIEPTWMDPSTRKTADLIRYQLAQSAIVSSLSFNVKSPRAIPDLENIKQGCKKNEVFSIFLRRHMRAASDLTDIFLAQRTRDDFFSVCAYSRDSAGMNSQLWVYAAASAATRRPDMRGLRTPPIWEILPEMFIPTEAIETARGQAALPTVMRSVVKVDRFYPNVVTIDENFTSTSRDPENRLWYFRQDLGVSSHHWHWHLVYGNPVSKPSNIGLRDRKGELFYYMHRNLVQRYNTERISNGLPYAVSLDVTTAPVLEEGYFPKLTIANSGRNWPGRQDNTRVFANYTEEPFVTSEDLRKWKDRLMTSIHRGHITATDGSRVELTPPKGIDIVAGLVENGGYASLNPDFYGSLHDEGHGMIGNAHDPYNKFNEGFGVMRSPVVAIRDPAFFRWHTFIDDLFEEHKQTLTPYTRDELVWPGVQVTNIEVSQRNGTKNTLVTSWMESDIDLTRGIDLRRSSAMNQGPVWARVTHLTHERFRYRISVQNQSRNRLPATVRIFMAPRFDENKKRIPFSRQRTLFFEMDKVSIDLAPGLNRIVRSSTDSTVTVPWEQTFQDLENYVDMDQLSSEERYCGCGWPQHMLLPRGSSAGDVFDLFVMLTDGRKDAVPNGGGDSGRCKQSVAFCGILDEKFPDAKAMGYPFDRKGRSANSHGIFTHLADDLEDFIPENSNMAAIQ
ncbi:unnamed protein product, partial [Allacma fusca]